MFKTIYKTKFTYWILFLYFVVLIWWVRLQSFKNENEVYYFYWLYGLIALSGALYGIGISVKKWGGWKSVIGRGLILLPCGLIAQWFGLQIWIYYNVIAKVEVPYPSLADIGYFGLIPFYTIGAIMFAKAGGVQFSIRTIKGRVQAVLIPLLFLGLAYWFFLKDIGFDLTDPIKLFFDIGYPLGEIIPVIIALITLTLSRKLLGGSMRNRILFLIGAFSFQFIAEYSFLYTVGKGLNVNGGWNDLLYATSYAIMSLALISFNNYE